MTERIIYPVGRLSGLTFERLSDELDRHAPTAIAHGGGYGVDPLADKYARKRKLRRIIAYPPAYDDPSKRYADLLDLLKTIERGGGYARVLAFGDGTEAHEVMRLACARDISGRWIKR